MRRGDEIHERPDARRRRAAGEEDGEEIEVVAAGVGEAFDQPAGLKMLLDAPKRLEREAAAIERLRLQHVAAAAGKMAADLDLLDGAPGAPGRIVVGSWFGSVRRMILRL